ncbi:hypothetical protein GCM10008906_07390 [Clostridium oceanicum]|uniref:Sugar transporter n=1 Tax=Clostridium oceanicum TaxID=1543 RepID=A0ABP3ULF2_9CLOT
MSMSAEHAEELKNESAVVCCRTEEGTVLTAENLEDPDIFPDMVDSGLLNIPDDCLKVGQVIGAKLLKTIDSLTPLTPAIVEGAKELEGSNEKEEVSKEEVAEEAQVEEPCEYLEDAESYVEDGVLKIRIEEGKGIDIELPL